MRRLSCLVPALCLSCAGADGKGGEEDDPSTEPLALLLVWDRSASMAEEAFALAQAVPALNAGLERRPDTLVAVTTNTAYATDGDTLHPGEGGTLVGPVVNTSDAGWPRALTEQILCRATDWYGTDVPRDASYVCEEGAPPPDVVSEEYLDCLCGDGLWEFTPAGAGQEEHLESILLTLCRAADPPIAACADPLSVWDATRDQTLSGWPDGRPVHVLMASDEGDDSRRMSQSDPDPTEAYVRPIEALAPGATVSALIPVLDPDTGDVPCNNAGTPTWSISRLLETVASTGGRAFPVAREDADGECAPADFGEVMGAWVAGL